MRLRCDAIVRVLLASVLLATALTPSYADTKPQQLSLTQYMRRQWYNYDHSLPLHAQVVPFDTLPSAKRYTVTYTSTHDQRVAGILALPIHGKSPFPCILLMHGSGGSKDTSYIKTSSIALTQLGYATFSIDAQYCGARKLPGRNGDIFLPDSYTSRDAWVQTVVDLRRAVDYLQTRQDINGKHIGFLGFSMGAMLGSVFGGVEKRISVFCLAVPGGALEQVVKHLKDYPFLEQHWPVALTPNIMRIVHNVTEITDPVHFVGLISPRPLFIITAKYDQVIPPESSRAFVKAARVDPNLTVQQIDASHVLNPMIIFTIRAWFMKVMPA